MDDNKDMAALIGRKTVLLFKWLLIVWILIMNGILTAYDIQYGWLIFISNIMMFTMGEGTPVSKFVSVEVGGLVGLLCAVVLLLVDTKLASAGLGAVPALLIPLAVILILLIVVHDKVPWMLNNTGFAYMTVATTAGNLPLFAANIKGHIIAFIIGSLIFNVVSLLILKLSQTIITKKYTKKSAA